MHNDTYTCIGKGGRYLYIGLSFGAGKRKGKKVIVYQCLATGIIYHRTQKDFDKRMKKLNQ